MPSRMRAPDGSPSGGVSGDDGGGAGRRAQYARRLSGRSRGSGWLSPQPGEALSAASVAGLRAYLGSLADQGLSPRTQGRRLSALRQFHKFLLREGVRKDDPTRLLGSPKLQPALPKNLTEAEVDQLLQAAAAAKGITSLAMRAGLEILYASGLRISELLTLPAVALTTDAEMLMIRGKGGKDRVVPLSATAREVALALRQARKQPGKWLFPGRDGKRPLTRQAFFLQLKEVALKAGLGSGAGFAACAATLLRLASAGARRRSAQSADAAGPCRHRDDANLHASTGGTVAATGRAPSSARHSPCRGRAERARAARLRSGGRHPRLKDTGWNIRSARSDIRRTIRRPGTSTQ